MALERNPAADFYIDVFDRVLDKGMVIDAWMRLSFAGIDFITCESRVIVASIETYLQYSDLVAQSTASGAPPAQVAGERDEPSASARG